MTQPSRRRRSTLKVMGGLRGVAIEAAFVAGLALVGGVLAFILTFFF